MQNPKKGEIACFLAKKVPSHNLLICSDKKEKNWHEQEYYKIFFFFNKMSLSSNIPNNHKCLYYLKFVWNTGDTFTKVSEVDVNVWVKILLWRFILVSAKGEDLERESAYVHCFWVFLLLLRRRKCNNLMKL